MLNEFIYNGHKYSYRIELERFVVVFDASGDPIARAEFDDAVEQAFGDVYEDGDWVESNLPPSFYFNYRKNFRDAAYWLAATM